MARASGCLSRSTLTPLKRHGTCETHLPCGWEGTHLLCGGSWKCPPRHFLPLWALAPALWSTLFPPSPVPPGKDRVPSSFPKICPMLAASGRGQHWPWTLMLQRSLCQNSLPYNETLSSWPGEGKAKAKGIKLCFSFCHNKATKTYCRGLAGKSKCSPRGTLFHPSAGRGFRQQPDSCWTAPCRRFCEGLCALRSCTWRFALCSKQQFLCMHFDLIMAVEQSGIPLIYIAPWQFKNSLMAQQ